MSIENLSHGAEIDPSDARDLKIESLFGAPLIHWDTEFRLEEPPNEDQNPSLSCVAQAWSYLHWHFNRKNWSRRDLYSRIFLPQGGAYIRDGGTQLTTNGQATRDTAPDPRPETEQEMRVGDPANEAIGIEASYYSLPNQQLDYLAFAIQNLGGFVFGVTGSNPGWQDLLNPRPPQPGESTWGHALYAFGYHMHGNQKCIIAKSSWCNYVKEHHIRENYFTVFPSMTFNAWALVPKKANMPQIKSQAKGAERRIVLAAADQTEWVSLCKVFGKDANAVDETVS